jgi:hypothetical protein
VTIRHGPFSSTSTSPCHSATPYLPDFSIRRSLVVFKLKLQNQAQFALNGTIEDLLKIRSAGRKLVSFHPFLLVSLSLTRSLDENLTTYCRRAAFSGTIEHSMACPPTFTRIIHHFVHQNRCTARCFVSLKSSTSISPHDRLGDPHFGLIRCDAPLAGSQQERSKVFFFFFNFNYIVVTGSTFFDALRFGAPLRSIPPVLCVIQVKVKIISFIRESNRESVNYEIILFHKVSQRRGIENTGG